MRSQLGLVVTRSNPLANPPANPPANPAAPPPANCLATTPSRTPGVSYVRNAVASPLCISAIVCTGGLGFGYAGVLAALLATLAVVALAVHATRYRVVQRYLEAQARIRARARRD